jgi:hypothetical protein
MPDDWSGAPTNSFWGFKLEISDKVTASSANVYRFYSLDEVFCVNNEPGCEYRNPSTVLCSDELTATRNVGAPNKQFGAGLFWAVEDAGSEAGLPAAGSTSSFFEPLTYNTEYDIKITAVHYDGTLYDAGSTTGLLRYSADSTLCAVYDVDICCSSSPKFSQCQEEEAFEEDTSECAPNMYDPPKLYGYSPKRACGWSTNFPDPPIDGPEGAFPYSRRLLASSRSLESFSCTDPMDYPSEFVGANSAISPPNDNSFSLLGVSEGECCQFAVVAKSDDCEVADVSECCADVRYTPEPSVAPTCFCPDSPEVYCSGSTPDEITVDVLCPDGFSCTTTI